MVTNTLILKIHMPFYIEISGRIVLTDVETHKIYEGLNLLRRK